MSTKRLLKTVIASFILAISINLPTANANNIVEFFNGDYNSAKAKASKEGKLFLLDFYADWCMPCKWMDQTTFRNPEVTGLLNENFVSLKVNIDEVEGYELKKQYNIQYLPTILIFNSNGELVERLEETMPPSKLAKILSSHNHGANKIAQRNNYNVSPTMMNKEEPRSTETEAFNFSKKDYENYQSANANRKYRLQIGVYNDHENAFNIVSRLRDQFIEPIIVLNDYRDGEVIYKVMMGEFGSMGEAESFNSILKNDFALDAIVQ